MTSVGRWIRLPAAERGIVLASIPVLALAALAPRAFGLVPALAVRQRRWPMLGAVDPARIARLVGSVASRLPWSSSCLTRALATARLAAWSGGCCEIVIAVKEPRDCFEAHAWIEVAGCATESMPAGEWRPVGRWSVPIAPHAP